MSPPNKGRPERGPALLLSVSRADGNGAMVAGLGPWLLALALGPAGVCAEWRLEAYGGGVQAPGESVQLSCRGSGFSFGDYPVWWYRRALSGHLEWLSTTSTGSYVSKYSSEVQGRATVSRDDSRSVSSLYLRTLHPHDSAHYFCAVHTGTGNPAEL
uniref:Uncharacterized LOC107324947 n=1 Tax=Coturnix japonica TaxID=93934 RepID=A0A8C2U8N2_COTJA